MFCIVLYCISMYCFVFYCIVLYGIKEKKGRKNEWEEREEWKNTDGGDI